MRINEMSFKDTLSVEEEMTRIMLNMCLEKDNISEWQFIETHKEKSKYARTDGILVKDGCMVASVENRGRYDVTWDYVKSQGTWLLTEAKLLANIELSKTLQIPFMFCGYFPNERIYTTLKVTNGRGNTIIKYEVRESWAKKNKNTDEKVKKRNAYIPIEQFKVIQF